MKQAELRYYISINVNGQHPLMRSAQGYTEYYSEALEAVGEKSYYSEMHLRMKNKNRQPDIL